MTTTIESLTDDLILDILSRLPAKSVGRFKCASKRWLGFVDHPDHRKNLPHRLAGFFYNSNSEERFPIFVNASDSVSGRPLFRPSFAFLPDPRRLHLLDCCNGLILCRLYDILSDEFRYVVCNPATEKWAALADHRSRAGRVQGLGTARLGFDPAASPHFHVFLLLLDGADFITGVDVYSSETSGWIHKEKQWDENVMLAYPQSAIVFFNGYLHLYTFSLASRCFISVVDTKGETWSNFEAPRDPDGGELFLAFIQQSQGQLHYATFRRNDDDDEKDAADDDDAQFQLQVYALENYASKVWTLKHTVYLQDVDVFGGILEGESFAFDWIAIHPESNLIYFIEGCYETLDCLSMDSHEATKICTLREGQPPYLPYVPSYSKLESLSM